MFLVVVVPCLLSCKAKDADHALKDALSCIELDPNWAKGYSRKVCLVLSLSLGVVFVFSLFVLYLSCVFSRLLILCFVVFAVVRALFVVLGLVFRSCVLVLPLLLSFCLLSVAFVVCQGAALLEQNRHYDALDAYNEGVFVFVLSCLWSALSSLFFPNQSEIRKKGPARNQK